MGRLFGDRDEMRFRSVVPADGLSPGASRGGPLTAWADEVRATFGATDIEVLERGAALAAAAARQSFLDGAPRLERSRPVLSVPVRRGLVFGGFLSTFLGKLVLTAAAATAAVGGAAAAGVNIMDYLVAPIARTIVHPPAPAEETKVEVPDLLNSAPATTSTMPATGTGAGGWGPDGYFEQLVVAGPELVAEPEEPKVEPEPVVTTPVVTTPVVTTPVVEEPVSDEPIADEPVVEEPDVDEGGADEPAVDIPIGDVVADEVPDDECVPADEADDDTDPDLICDDEADTPVVEEPVVEEPVVEDPVVEEPVEEPVVEEVPAVDVPVPESAGG